MTPLEMYFEKVPLRAGSRAARCYEKYLGLPYEMRLALDSFCWTFVSKVRGIDLEDALELLGALGLLERESNFKEYPWQRMWRTH